MTSSLWWHLFVEGGVKEDGAAGEEGGRSWPRRAATYGVSARLRAMMGTAEGRLWLEVCQGGRRERGF